MLQAIAVINLLLCTANQSNLVKGNFVTHVILFMDTIDDDDNNNNNDNNNNYNNNNNHNNDDV